MHDVTSDTPVSKTDDGIACVESLNGLSQRQLHIRILDYFTAGRPRTISKDGVSYTFNFSNERYNQVTFVCVDDAPADGDCIGSDLSKEDKKFYDDCYDAAVEQYGPNDDSHIEKGQD